MVSGGLPNIQEERALNGLYVRTGLNVHTIFQEDIRRAQNIFPCVRGVSHVVQARIATAMLLGAGQIVGFVVDGEPASAYASII